MVRRNTLTHTLAYHLIFLAYNRLVERLSSEIAVFRQPKGLPVCFAGYKIEPATIGNKKCLMVDVGRYCAITFSSDEAQYVVIGRNDDIKVAEIIDELLASL